MCGLAIISPPSRRELLSRDSKRGLASPTTLLNGKRTSVSRWLQGRFRTPTAHSSECTTLLVRGRNRPAKENREDDLTLEQRLRLSSRSPQLRWPKVFGRAESLNWRGFRDTSRSERIYPLRFFGVKIDDARTRIARRHHSRSGRRATDIGANVIASVHRVGARRVE